MQIFSVTYLDYIFVNLPYADGGFKGLKHITNTKNLFNQLLIPKLVWLTSRVDHRGSYNTYNEVCWV